MCLTPAVQASVDAPLRHFHHGLTDVGSSHLGHAEFTLGERDRNLCDDEPVGDGAPGQVDLEAVALRIDVVEVDLLQNVATVGPVTGGDVVDADAQGPPRVGVGLPGRGPAPPRPFLHVAALDVAGADDQVGAAVDGLEQ